MNWRFCVTDTFFHFSVLFHLPVSSVVLLNYDTEPAEMLIIQVFQVVQLKPENILESNRQVSYTSSDLLVIIWRKRYFSLRPWKILLTKNDGL